MSADQALFAADVSGCLGPQQWIQGTRMNGGVEVVLALGWYKRASCEREEFGELRSRIDVRNIAYRV